VNIPSGNREEFYHIVPIKSDGISAQLQGALAGETDRRLLAGSPICSALVRALDVLGFGQMVLGQWSS
jgi:hypothetical protein